MMTTTKTIIITAMPTGSKPTAGGTLSVRGVMPMSTTNSPIYHLVKATQPATVVVKSESPVDLGSMSDGSTAENSSEYGGPRKRQRLTHLTTEEKMYRRKMKNRMAAQSARDRKKAKMEDLEESTIRMETENQSLLAENSTLKLDNEKLRSENELLRQQLDVYKKLTSPSDQLSQSPQPTPVVPPKTSVFTVGPAASISVPLPKGQVKSWLRVALVWLLTAALSSNCCDSSSRPTTLKSLDYRRLRAILLANAENCQLRPKRLAGTVWKRRKKLE